MRMVAGKCGRVAMRTETDPPDQNAVSMNFVQIYRTAASGYAVLLIIRTIVMRSAARGDP